MSQASRPVALVTGASRGIGKATAIDLAAAGYDVVVTARTLVDGEGRSDTDPNLALPGGLDTTVKLIEEHGVTGLGIPMDLLDRSSVMAAVAATMDRFGRIDVLVNNAIYQGRGVLDLFADLDERDILKIFEGNVFAQLAIIRLVLPHLLDGGGGTMINMISATAYADPPAKVGEGGWGLGYAMSKAAFARITPLLHVEYREQGLRIFSVDPGFTVTERMEASGRVGQHAQFFKAGTPEVIGRANRWLATEPEADEFLGKVVMAQREVKRRLLLPGWPA